MGIDEDSRDGRNAQEGGRRERILNKPSGRVLKSSWKYSQGSPPSHRASAVGPPAPATGCGLNSSCLTLRLTAWAVHTYP